MWYQSVRDINFYEYKYCYLRYQYEREIMQYKYKFHIASSPYEYRHAGFIHKSFYE